MAEGKKGILVYADWISKFEELTDEEAGRLIKHFFRYVNDMNPEAPDRITKLMFVDIKNTLKRNLNKYKTIKEERSYNGKLGNLKKYNIDLYDLVVKEEMSLENAENIAKTRKTSHSEKSTAKLAVSDSVSVSVSVNDNVNVNVNNTDDDVEEKSIDDKIILIYEKFIEEIKNNKHDLSIESIYMRLRVKKGTLTKILKDYKGQIIIDKKLHRTTQEMLSHFSNYCNTQDRIGKLDEFKNHKKQGAL
jgi:hypothetical protein